MKKFFIAFAAIATALSCSNDDIISIDRQAIGFGNPFVENSVRADYSTAMVNAFKVYGTVTGTDNNNTVELFSGADVTRGSAAYGAVWACNQTEYWVPNCTYAFQAVVDGTIADGKIAYTVGQDTDSDGVSDLLYATANVTTDASSTPSGDVATTATGEKPVAFTFDHLLSKIGFSFKNGSANTAYGFEVTAVSFTGHFASGTYTIGATTPWGSTTPSTTAISFGTGTETHQIIPGAQTLSITVAYDILYNGETMSSTSFTKPLEYTFEQNNSYSIVVTIPAPGKPIQFSVVEDLGWEDGGSTDLDKE